MVLARYLLLLPAYYYRIAVGGPDIPLLLVHIVLFLILAICYISKNDLANILKTIRRQIAWFPRSGKFAKGILQVLRRQDVAWSEIYSLNHYIKSDYIGRFKFSKYKFNVKKKSQHSWLFNTKRQRAKMRGEGEEATASSIKGHVTRCELRPPISGWIYIEANSPNTFSRSTLHS